MLAVNNKLLTDFGCSYIYFIAENLKLFGKKPEDHEHHGCNATVVCASAPSCPEVLYYPQCYQWLIQSIKYVFHVSPSITVAFRDDTIHSSTCCREEQSYTAKVASLNTLLHCGNNTTWKWLLVIIILSVTAQDDEMFSILGMKLNQ